MNEYDVKRLALVFAVQAEVEGMKVENLQREQSGLSCAYAVNCFDSKADELRELASKHNEQL